MHARRAELATGAAFLQRARLKLPSLALTRLPTLLQVMGRPSWVPVPDFALQALLGEGARVVLEGQRVVPSRAQVRGLVGGAPARPGLRCQQYRVLLCGWVPGVLAGAELAPFVAQVRLPCHIMPCHPLTLGGYGIGAGHAAPR